MAHIHTREGEFNYRASTHLTHTDITVYLMNDIQDLNK